VTLLRHIVPSKYYPSDDGEDGEAGEPETWKINRNTGIRLQAAAAAGRKSEGAPAAYLVSARTPQLNQEKFQGSRM